MSTYSVLLWTLTFPPHPPYPQPSFACWWLGRFLCRPQFGLSLRAVPPGWRAAWRRHSGASTQPRRASAWPVDETPGPKRGTGMWRSCVRATDRRALWRTRRKPGIKKINKRQENVSVGWNKKTPAETSSTCRTEHLTCVTPTRTSLLTEPPPFNISPPLFRKPDPPRRNPVAISSRTSFRVARFTFWRITVGRGEFENVKKKRCEELFVSSHRIHRPAACLGMRAVAMTVPRSLATATRTP